MLPYVPIFVFAIIEGEIYYIAMCVAATAGKLDWRGVMMAGALGGSAGDQFWFYLLRGRIHWLDRFPRLAKYRDTVSARVKAHQDLMLLLTRFLPGLRVAIPVAAAAPSEWAFACALVRLRFHHCLLRRFVGFRGCSSCGGRALCTA